MMSSIVSFVEKYLPVSAEDRKVLEEGQTLKRFQKKQEVLVGSDLNNFGLFLSEGICYLQKIDPDGNLKVLDFYFQGEPILLVMDLSSEIECFSLVALKDSAVMMSDARHVESQMSKYPKFERVCRIFAEEQLRKSKKIAELVKLQDPAEKLNALMLWKPEIINNVPKHLIANFLGMRSETLSRITSRVSEKFSEN
jgi:CRP-like cAMP-binding protein